MISEFQATILGAVEGLTEFLPVSSSAHLVIVPWLFRWEDPGLAFDVALHLGTLVALLIYYGREWLNMGMSLVRRDPASRRLLTLLLIASLPGAIIGLMLEKEAETVFRAPWLIAVAASILGIILWVSDAISSQKLGIRQITVRDALLIGLSQALAIVPGVSRSGATITMARIIGLNRQDAANFSFLMATPIIAGAGMLEARKIMHEGINADVMWGFAAAAVFGLIAIAALVKFVRTRTYQPFAWYRLVMAAGVILVWWMRA